MPTSTDVTAGTLTANIDGDGIYIPMAVHPPALAAPDSPTTASDLTYEIGFVVPVTGLAANDFALAGTAIGCAVEAPSQSDDVSWSVQVTGCSDGTLIVHLKSHSVADEAGNLMPAADIDAPTVTVISELDLAGTVFNDTSADGIFDAGESGAEGWTVELRSGDGLSLLATTTSAADGRYGFSGTALGQAHLVCLVAQAGQSQTLPAANDICVPLGSGYYAHGYSPTPVADATIGDLDFGVVVQPSVSLDLPDLTGSPTVPVALTVTDQAGAGIDGYIVSEDGTAPVDGSDPRWQGSEPTSVDLAAGSDGTRTVFAWVIDGNGTISARAEDATLLDTTPPTVSLDLPDTTATIEVPVTLGGDDGAGAGIDAWYLSLADVTPVSADPGWTTTLPTSFTLPGPDGSYTLHAWSRDAAGHVSAGASDSTVLDTTVPALEVHGSGEFEGDRGTTKIWFEASLSGPAGSDVTFHWSTVDDTATAGSDYVAASSSAIIPAGSLSTMLAVTINGDTSHEADERFDIEVTNVSGAEYTLAAGPAGGIVPADSGGTGGYGTILNDDGPPAVSVNDPANVEDAGSVSFTVSLDAVSGLDTTVPYATVDGTATAGSDYVATSGDLVIPAGDTTGTVAVTVTGDTEVEPDETFDLVLSSPINATISDATGTATITNDDTAAPVPSVSLDLPDLTGSPTVPVALTVTDQAGAGIDGYIVSEDGTAPVDGSDPRWQGSEPTSVDLAAGSDGTRTVFAWVIDGNGTISARAEDATLLDTTPPTVSLDLPDTTATIEVPVTLGGDDGAGAGIDAWYLSLADVTPVSADPGWTTTLPTRLHAARSRRFLHPPCLVSRCRRPRLGGRLGLDRVGHHGAWGAHRGQCQRRRRQRVRVVDGSGLRWRQAHQRLRGDALDRCGRPDATARRLSGHEPLRHGPRQRHDLHVHRGRGQRRRHGS